MTTQFISILVTIGKSKKHINYTAPVGDIDRLEDEILIVKNDDRRIRAVYPELAAEQLHSAKSTKKSRLVDLLIRTVESSFLEFTWDERLELKNLIDQYKAEQ